LLEDIRGVKVGGGVVSGELNAQDPVSPAVLNDSVSFLDKDLLRFHVLIGRHGLLHDLELFSFFPWR